MGRRPLARGIRRRVRRAYQDSPDLSALADPEELREEIAGSKARIESELDRPVLHFCYPNGKMRDIGPAASRLCGPPACKRR
jgi:hypothetical protein